MPPAMADSYDTVMGSLEAHIAPLMADGATLTLIVCTGSSQEIYSTDSKVEDLIVAVATDIVARQEVELEVASRRGVTRGSVH
jgi:hypothetical protein